MKYVVILLLLLLSCSNKSVSDNFGGTGTGVGNGIVVSGVVVTGNNTPLANTTLEIVPKNHLEYSSISVVDTVQTDTEGKFSWETDSIGMYRMWIIDESGVGAIRDITIDSTQDKIELDTIKTLPLRNYWLSFAGTTHFEELQVELYGSRLTYNANAASIIHFEIPEGEHYAKITFASKEYSTVDSVKLSVDDTVPVAVLPDDMIAKNLFEDSLIVHSILRMNFPTLDPNQYPFILLYGNMDDGVGLRVTGLWITGCDTLPPFVGGLVALESLTVKDGLLTTIPEQVGNLPELMKLDLSNNEITTVPKELGNFESTLKKLILSRNDIITLPDELAKLSNLDTVDLTGNVNFDPHAQSSTIYDWLKDNDWPGLE